MRNFKVKPHKFKVDKTRDCKFLVILISHSVSNKGTPIAYSEIDIPHSAALCVCSLHHYEPINTNSVSFIKVNRYSSAKTTSQITVRNIQNNRYQLEKGNNTDLLK
jgi:hypothetical protein